MGFLALHRAVANSGKHRTAGSVGYVDQISKKIWQLIPLRFQCLVTHNVFQDKAKHHARYGTHCHADINRLEDVLFCPPLKVPFRHGKGMPVIRQEAQIMIFFRCHFD